MPVGALYSVLAMTLVILACCSCANYAAAVNFLLLAASPSHFAAQQQLSPHSQHRLLQHRVEPKQALLQVLCAAAGLGSTHRLAPNAQRLPAPAAHTDLFVTLIVTVIFY
jgi:hypothetical protein